MLIDICWKTAQKKVVKEMKSRRTKPVNFSKLQLRRVFNNSSFEQGGRFYGGWWQILPKSYRKYITIDDEATVEVDFTGLHPTMIYAIKGAECPDDPYELPGFTQRREAIKAAANIMINSKDLGKVYGAIFEDEKCESIRYEAKSVVAALKKKHTSISEFFCSGSGLKLQYEDSQMAEEILLSLSGKGIVALPIHDSFIVKLRHLKELDDTMREVSTRRFGREFKVKHDDEAGLLSFKLVACDSSESDTEIDEVIDLISNENMLGIYLRLEDEPHRYYQEQVRQMTRGLTV